MKILDPTTAIPIAGSGTGHQPVNTSRLAPEAKITAFDISRRGLV